MVEFVMAKHRKTTKILTLYNKAPEVAKPIYAFLSDKYPPYFEFCENCMHQSNV